MTNLEFSESDRSQDNEFSRFHGDADVTFPREGCQILEGAIRGSETTGRQDRRQFFRERGVDIGRRNRGKI